MLEEAKKRDHRKLGKELDLFTFSDLVGAGLPLFTPKGTLLRDLIVEKIHGLQKKYGYQKSPSPTSPKGISTKHRDTGKNSVTNYLKSKDSRIKSLS